jgi:hypothetical protein
MKKVIFITVAILFFGLVVVLIKYVDRVAPSNTSTIKKYIYFGKVDEFLALVKIFSNADSSLIATMTDTTGTTKTGYRYYMDIEIKNKDHDILYNIACEANKNASKLETIIKLVFAFDRINKIGGYNKNAAGVTKLLDYFDNNFILALENNQHIHLFPLKNS